MLAFLRNFSLLLPTAYAALMDSIQSRLSRVIMRCTVLHLREPKKNCSGQTTGRNSAHPSRVGEPLSEALP